MEPTPEQIRITIAQFALTQLNYSQPSDRTEKKFNEWYDVIAAKVIRKEKTDGNI